jgi:hypothetical protein
MGKYLRISSYIRSPSLCMTLQLLHSKFSYIRGKFDFLFYQCSEKDSDKDRHTASTLFYKYGAREKIHAIDVYGLIRHMYINFELPVSLADLLISLLQRCNFLYGIRNYL